MFIFLSIMHLVMAGISLSSGSEWWRLYMFASVMFMCGEYILVRINDIEELLKSEGEK
jgi:hypothetical protein